MPKATLWASGGEGASFIQGRLRAIRGTGRTPAAIRLRGFGGLEEPPERRRRCAARPEPAEAQRQARSASTRPPAKDVPGNPLFGNLGTSENVENERRIVARGFRNPFRFTHRSRRRTKSTSTTSAPRVYEEIDRFPPSSELRLQLRLALLRGSRKARTVRVPRPRSVCEHLYETPGSTSPAVLLLLARIWSHARKTHALYEPGSAISGLAFYEGGSFPPEYDGALFFADAVRGCIYVMRAGEDGRPDPSKVEPFLTEGGFYPGVDIEVGPEGDLFYVSLYSDEEGSYGPGAIHRITLLTPMHRQARLKADQVSWCRPCR